jgi:hypothetical protein
MLTLTYPRQFPMDGRTVKRHWHNMRTWLVRSGLKGAWFLEFQKRGAPHFHVFLNGRVPASEVSRRWYEVVGSEDLDHLVAGTRIEQLREAHAAPAYAAKYAAKVEQKEPPEGFSDVGRFWGTFGDLDVSPVEVLEQGPKEQFVDLDTGALAPAPGYQAIRVARRLTNVRRKQRGLSPYRDNGRRSCTFYDVSGHVSHFLAWYTGRVVSIGSSPGKRRTNPDV